MASSWTTLLPVSRQNVETTYAFDFTLDAGLVESFLDSFVDNSCDHGLYSVRDSVVELIHSISMLVKFKIDEVQDVLEGGTSRLWWKELSDCKEGN